jgi:hypothetical protein
MIVSSKSTLDYTRWVGESVESDAKRAINQVAHMIQDHALSIPKVVSTRVHYDIINLKFADGSVLTIKLVEGEYG